MRLAMAFYYYFYTSLSSVKLFMAGHWKEQNQFRLQQIEGRIIDTQTRFRFLWVIYKQFETMWCYSVCVCVCLGKWQTISMRREEMNRKRGGDHLIEIIVRHFLAYEKIPKIFLADEIHINFIYIFLIQFKSLL